MEAPLGLVRRDRPAPETDPQPPTPNAQPPAPSPQPPALVRRPFWLDRLCAALALACVGTNAALALFLWRRLPDLPEFLPTHFNAFGEVDLIGARTEILKLPVIGMIIWASNTALATITAPYDRVLARLLLGAALLAQILIAAAALRIIA